jgi:beta-mannanase
MKYIVFTLCLLNIICLFGCKGTPAENFIVPDSGCYTGAFLYGISLADYNKITGKKTAIGMWFASIQTGREQFPVNGCEAKWALGQLPSITVEPQTMKLQDIIDGKYDELYTRWANGAKAFGKPVMIRWAHEMNGNWYYWSGIKNGGGTLDGYGDPNIPDGPERYVDAYRRIHDIFINQGCSNVIWIWCPNAGSPVVDDWNDIKFYYPGDEYVDWIGMDGYNWGDVNKDLGWQSFSQIYTSIYEEIETINKDKPIIIGEFASAEKGGNKGEWITDTFYQIKHHFPRIKAFVWFQYHKEAAWTVNSSRESEKAFQKALSDPYFLGSF